MKTCNACKIEKPPAEFGKNKSNKDGMMYQCKLCNTTRVKGYLAENPVQEREWYKNDRYKRKGITKEQFDAMLASQGGVCAICKLTTIGMVADHDHSCCPGQRTCGECFRGVLCQPCNRGLGQLGDSVEALTNAINYLTS